ncbi:MAG TPA: helix-turn-helix transcriptional regulator [Kofleriaceae bacterium]|jgi:transcriptional regulator with XRE-family HTH domain
MKRSSPRAFLAKKRHTIAAKVRSLRQSRRWGQIELARQLGLSQSRLSEIERGKGSFSAEQLLLILSVFNVSIADFSDERTEPDQELHNALARLGAAHLHETENGLLSEKLSNASNVIREVLVSGSPRLVTGAAPVLLLNARDLNLRSIQNDLRRLGYEHRLPWLLANTIRGLELTGQTLPRRFRSALSSLTLALNQIEATVSVPVGASVDVLDPTIRTQKTLEAVQRKSSRISLRWGIVSSLTPEDFVEPLRVALETD